MQDASISPRIISQKYIRNSWVAGLFCSLFLYHVEVHYALRVFVNSVIIEVMLFVHLQKKTYYINGL